MSAQTQEIATADPFRPLTAGEKRQLAELAKPENTIDVVVSAEIDGKALWDAISVTCRALTRARVQEEILIPVLGKLLLVARDNQELWQERFENYEALIDAIESQFRVGRSTCYEARKMVEKWEPAGFELKTFEEVDRTKWRLLDKVVDKEAVTQKWAKGLVEKARDLPMKDFRAYLEEKDYIKEDEGRGAQIIIPCTKKLLKEWRKFADDADIQGHVGSKDPAKILDAMMSEVEGDWKVQAQEVAGG